MKKITQNFSRCLLGVGASLLTTLAAQAATDVTFQVDMTGQTPTEVLIKGSFNGWGTPDSPALTNDPSGPNPNIWSQTVTITDAPGTVESCKFFYNPGGNWEGDPNRQFVLGAGTQVLPLTSWNVKNWPAPTNKVTFQVDMSQEINLGNFLPGQSVTVSGDFEGWDAGLPLTNNPTLSGLSSNIYSQTLDVVGIPPTTINYKFRGNGGWESPASTSGNNRQATITNATQILPLVYYSDAPYAALLTSNISFSVDMTIVALTDTNFNPASVTINGDFCGWGGVQMTNNPNSAKPNIYTCITTYNSGPGSTLHYQYRYTLLSNPATTVYDHFNGANGGNGDRFVPTPAIPTPNTGTNILSVFNDASLNDYLLQPTPVYFSVDMNGAVGTDSHAFDPQADKVYINGQFANWYAWSGGVNPSPAPPGYLMVQSNNSTIYTNTIVFPAGTTPVFNYKYGMDAGDVNGGPTDNEATFGNNHTRVVRNTVQNPYVLAADKFGYMYAEPYFSSSSTSGGNLSVGAKSGGSIPVQWLGRPGARLQYSSSLTGTWQSIDATDGATWNSGVQSTNGFVSTTNWPAGSGNTFFRLIKTN